MRPGQAAPEFHHAVPCMNDRFRRFNEAGAGCPGIQVRLRVDAQGASASMRPGQAAPEFISWKSCSAFLLRLQ